MMIVQKCCQPGPTEAALLSNLLNAQCLCSTLDRSALKETLVKTSGQTELWEKFPETHPHLFAQTPVFITQDNFAAMRETVAAIECTSRLPAYQTAALQRAGDSAQLDHGPIGAFMGYDFHIDENGPHLIEVNTNAGGALLNAALYQAQHLCCADMEPTGGTFNLEHFSAHVTEMFISEWRRQGHTGKPELLAIIDEHPEDQYLYPEFLLVQDLIQKAGIDAVILDPSELSFENGRLWYQRQAVDMVYNRLVDFDLSQPQHQALRDAYMHGETVVTPNPHNHALLADKRNLVLLSSERELKRFGVPARDRQTLLRTIPRTQYLNAACADALWATRKGLFFKPATGHGGKAVYRGDKITRKAWNAVLKGDYVAQDKVAPGLRAIEAGDQPTRHKMDFRLYTYDGAPLIAAARLYQGQTTNFRTPGGGFASVYII